MAIDSLAVFNSTFAVLPRVLDGSWTTNISEWLSDRVTNKAIVNGVTHLASPFTFNKSVFKTQLDALFIQTSQATAAVNLANAWKAATDVSTLASFPNDFINPGGPTLTWQTILSSVLDSASRTAARDQLVIDLTNAPIVLLVSNSLFPKAFRDAFLNLTCSIAGTDVATGAPLSINGAALL